MTSRKREAPVVTMHVRSANVLRENTESRRSLDSSEKNRLNIENTTTPTVRAMASVCPCSAQLTTLSVPIAITSPTETSQARTPLVRIGWLGGRGRRSISPSTGLLYPSPMDWIVTVVKATHKTCSGRSGLLGPLGPGAHRDPDVGLFQRGRVVDAVAGHGDDLAFALEQVHQADLVLWSDAGDHADIGDRLHRLVIGHRAELRPA